MMESASESCNCIGKSEIATRLAAMGGPLSSAVLANTNNTAPGACCAFNSAAISTVIEIARAFGTVMAARPASLRARLICGSSACAVAVSSLGYSVSQVFAASAGFPACSSKMPLKNPAREFSGSSTSALSIKACASVFGRFGGLPRNKDSA